MKKSWTTYVCQIPVLCHPNAVDWAPPLGHSGLIVMGQYSHGGKRPVVAEDCMASMPRIFPGQVRVLISPPKKHSYFRRPGRSWVGRPYADKNYWGADKDCGEHRHMNAQRKKQKQLFLHLHRQTYSCGGQVEEKRNGNQQPVPSSTWEIR